MTNKLIAPSILSADFGRLAEEVQAVEAAGADVIHVDVMDGHFVPNITIGPLIVSAVRKATKLPIDVHLMIENADQYVNQFMDAGADWVSIHVENGYHLDRTLNVIRERGAKAGIALNPATHISNIYPLLNLVDFVLIMTVNPGFGGQEFIPYCKDKIATLRNLIDKQFPNVFIEIDGGVKADNISELSNLGTDVFVAGSAVFKTKDYAQTIAGFKKAIAEESTGAMKKV